MPRSWTWHCVGLLRTDVSEEHIASIITVPVFPRSLLQLLVNANVDLSSPILVTLMSEAIRSSETSVLIRAKLRNIPEHGILQYET
jgi:hypothetical protein